MEPATEAESTLRESLERERERADTERGRAEEVQLEVERLREPRRERSWWKSFFGFE